MRKELQGLPAETNGDTWFWHGEQILALLDDHQPQVCVELGTHRGGSAIATARLVSTWGGGLTCVDPWAGEVTQAECQANLDRAGVAPYVRLLRGTSLHVAAAWRGPIDYLYVDADHSQEACRADLEAWWPFLRVGGLLAGDDYGDPRYRGVRRAWDGFEQAHGQAFQRQATPGVPRTQLVWGVKR